MTKTPVGAEKSRDYLHKKKLYELLESLVDRLDMMKSATYRFYRGSEWLECTSDNMNCSYKIYHEADFFSLNVLQWDEAEEKFVEIERITYRLVEKQLVKTYQRTEAYEKTEKIKRWIENHKQNELKNRLSGE